MKQSFRMIHAYTTFMFTAKSINMHNACHQFVKKYLARLNIRYTATTAVFNSWITSLTRRHCCKNKQNEKKHPLLLYGQVTDYCWNRLEQNINCKISLCWASSVGSRHDATLICGWDGTGSCRLISSACMVAQQQTRRPPLLLSMGRTNGTDGRLTVT